MRGIGHVFVVVGAGGGCGEAELVAGLQVQCAALRRAAGRASQRPAIQPLPLVGAGLVGGDRGEVGLGRAVLEVLREVRAQDVFAEILGGVAAELDRAERAAFVDLLAVMPRAHHQFDHVAAGVLRLDRAIHGERAVAVFLIPQAVHQHHRHFQRLRGEQLVYRLVAPEAVVGGMRQHLVPEAELFHAVGVGQRAGGAVVHEQVVLVVVVRPPLDAVVAAGGLFVDVAEVLLAERAVVEPVVAHPAVDHRVHRHRHFQRGMRIDQRHQRLEAIVGDAQRADLAVRLGDVLHQPVDGVVRVGGVVHRRRVQRPVHRPVHHVVALGTVLAAHVLHHADVAVLDDDVGGVVVALQHRAEVAAHGVRGQCLGVVRRAGEQHAGMAGTFRDQDDGVQLHPVAHRDHHVARDVVVIASGRHELRRGLAGVGRILGLRCIGGLQRAAGGKQQGQQGWHHNGEMARFHADPQVDDAT